MKKLISVLLLVAVLTSLCSVGVSAAGKKATIKNVNDAMIYLLDHDVINIKKATLYDGKTNLGRVYVIALCGCDMAWETDHVNCVPYCALSMLGINNPYVTTVRDMAIKKIPAGSRVVLFGHSQGGMVCQQLAADKQMKKRFEILNVLTMGSPYITVCGREGTLHRMADSGDVVPYLSTAGAANLFLGNFSYERCGHFGDPDSAHNRSYNIHENWRAYDAFGIENGSYVLKNVG